MKPLDDIRESLRRGKLLILTGAGCSKGLTSKSKSALDWAQLIENGLEYCASRSLVNDSRKGIWSELVQSHDMDELLSAAEFVSRKLGAPKGPIYARWLQDLFGSMKPDRGLLYSAIQKMERSGAFVSTLNYDTLLEQILGYPSIDFVDPPRVLSWLRAEEKGVLHVHGVWNKPDTCVLGIRDYEATLTNEARTTLQRFMSSFHRILFIGCGDTLRDPNFTALIAWMRSNFSAGGPKHYALVRDAEFDGRLGDPAWAGFVEPLSYGGDHSDLPKFITDHIMQGIEPVEKSKRRKPTQVNQHDQTIAAYKRFIIKDCGEMTIEGVRADMDIGSRKFQLERLFVPLHVMQMPPEFSETEPERMRKVRKWMEQNPPITFGQAFKSSKHIALLALPGGGKTLLLKRLAVAYSSPQRRSTSSDDLPALDLIPVMIRCREWKDHIRKPIKELLKNIAQITGEQDFAELAEALEIPLKRGNVLLLVDGLDEIHDDADRAIFVEHLERFVGDNPKIRLVVTSREAGIELVAPYLVRFCRRWKIAPLGDEEIRTLCLHWHRLLIGGTREAADDAERITEDLLGNSSLRRLAENPLLLTMLLVVKHGAGGQLPPDRVSLYERAVEVLLDTWNIKGHEALNAKEAVPQLACVAYELLKEGKQTATEGDLVAMLDKAREVMPSIGRFAKGTSHAFLKRVELRSSLLVEGGHTKEGTKVVPFYQFRHLTFQEYLAAVAVVNGHYFRYNPTDSIVAPLTGVMTADEWKEVIPMVAVLARKQATPLLQALVNDAKYERAPYLSDGGKPRMTFKYGHRLPSSVSRIIQSLIEEAEFPQSILIEALEVIAFFAQGCQSGENWQALSRGPYGNDLRHHAWLLYQSRSWPTEIWVRNTVALLEAYSFPLENWRTEGGVELVLGRLGSPSSETRGRTILLVAGSLWLQRADSWLVDKRIYEILESAIQEDQTEIWEAAGWAWAFVRFVKEEDSEKSAKTSPRPKPETIRRIIELFFKNFGADKTGTTGFLVCHIANLPRGSWDPQLTEDQIETVRGVLKRDRPGTYDVRERYTKGAAIVLAFQSPNAFTDEEIVVAIEQTMIEIEQSAIEPILNHFALTYHKTGLPGADEPIV